MGAGYAMRNCVKPHGSLDTQNTRLLDYVDVTDDSEMPIIHDTFLSPPAEIMIWEGRPRLYAGKFVHLYLRGVTGRSGRAPSFRAGKRAEPRRFTFTPQPRS